MSSSNAPLSPFQIAVRDFLEGIEDTSDFNLSTFHTIDDVYAEIENIQEEQARKHGLRNMRAIQPFLACLHEYSGVIDTIVQVKPDVLALIWGPIKFLIQILRNHARGMVKVLEMMRKIGETLPEFKNYAVLFHGNERLSDILCLFYKDILDFYSILLSFFQIKGWRLFFEALWPRHAEKVEVVIDNIDHHKVLLSGEVTMASIREARNARSRALQEYDRAQKAREKQEFESCKMDLSPRLYDYDLERIKNDCYDGTCHWLEEDADFRQWIGSSNRASSFFWLVGIPGAGKSHLAASFVSDLTSKGNTVLFAILTYKHSEAATTLSVLHSFIFQLLYKHSNLRPIIQEAYDKDYQKLKSTSHFNLCLLSKLIQCTGTTYVVVDGLDEISERERKFLINSLFELSKNCALLKVMISSREETGILTLVGTKPRKVRIGLRNSDDIKRYCDRRIEQWLGRLSIDERDEETIQKLVGSVPSKAEGMFLYAKLVLEHLEAQPDIKAIKQELTSLPDGLERAYGRILERIEKMRPQQQSQARNILSWILCSKGFLRRQELIQALMINEGAESLDLENKILQDLSQLCGPIIEYQGEYVTFVHFTAKEFLHNDKSGPFIVKPIAHQYIAHACMTYLMFRCFDPSMSDANVDCAILNGEYILQAYAITSWLHHVRESCRHSLSPIDFFNLCKKISEFLDKRNNPKFSPGPASTSGFACFKEMQPTIYTWLGAIESTSSSSTNSWSDNQVIDEEPLVLSKCFQRVQTRIQKLLCRVDTHSDHCRCHELESHYGSRHFKCHNILCEFSRIGFATECERSRHSRHHKRYFKCNYPTCDFSKIGFLSQTQLEHHTEICHKFIQQDEETTSLQIGCQDIAQAMMDAIEMGEPNYLSAMLEGADPGALDILIHIAYLKGSDTSILSLLWSRGALIMLSRERIATFFAYKSDETMSFHYQNESLSMQTALELELYKVVRDLYPDSQPASSIEMAISSGSLNAVQWLIRKEVTKESEIETSNLPKDMSNKWKTPLMYFISVYYYLANSSNNKTALQLEMLQMLVAEKQFDYELDINGNKALNSLLGCRFLPEDQSSHVEAVKLLLDIGGSLTTSHWSNVVTYSHSCDLARLLLEHGINLNDLIKPFRSKRIMPLQHVLKTQTRKSAAFARFLLENGAILPKDGPRNPNKFSRDAGMSWEELVESTRHLRGISSQETACDEEPKSYLQTASYSI